MNTLFWVYASWWLLCFLPEVELTGQKRVYAYLDMGSNNVSDGPFLNTAGLATYEFGKYQVGAGFKLDLVSHNENVLSGFTLDGSRQVFIKTFPINIKGFYLLNIHNELLFETNPFLRLSGKYEVGAALETFLEA